MTATAPLPDTFDEAGIDRFGFGRNWLDYQTSIDSARMSVARQDIEQWLGSTSLSGLRVLDIGSGSGLHSYCLHAMGAATLVSFDYDTDSVQATQELHRQAGAPASWRVTQGSVLDASFMASLGTFDLVYSWGVLHHTGRMWQAISHAAGCVGPGGRFFISIYAKGPNFSADLALKQRYHDASLSGKRRMEFEWIAAQYAQRARYGLAGDGWWTQGCERGMDPYFDLVDWLGGLPYEVATVPELTSHLRTLGIATRRVRASGDGGCHILVGERTSDTALSAPSADEAPAAAVRVGWSAGAPVLWIGALEAADAPARVVDLAQRAPQLSFIMLAAGFAQLDPEMQRRLGAAAPNLRIIERPTDPTAMAQLLDLAGAVVSTADAGPDRTLLALSAGAGVPTVSLHDTADTVLSTTGMGATGHGDLQQLVRELVAVQESSIRYSRASLAGIIWASA